MSEYIVRETGYPGTIHREIVGELVRCKDCKYWVTVVDNAEYGLCAAIKSDIGVRGRNEYCSRGKRREDDSDKD